MLDVHVFYICPSRCVQELLALYELGSGKVHTVHTKYTGTCIPCIHAQQVQCICTLYIVQVGIYSAAFLVIVLLSLVQ